MHKFSETRLRRRWEIHQTDDSPCRSLHLAARQAKRARQPIRGKGAEHTHVNIAICERIGEGEGRRRERITCLAGTAGMRIVDYVQVESRGRHVRRVAAGRAIMRRRRVSIDRRGREARRRRPRPRELRTTERATSFRNYACISEVC